MAFHARMHLVVLSLLVLLPEGIDADVFCLNCRRTYRPPGGGDSESIGIVRVNGCPLCQREDCKTAAKRAQEIRDRYKRFREQYEQLNKRIADLRSGGRQVPNTDIAEQANLNFALGQLELQYSILNADCPKEVPGDNVWDGLYGGPVENSPVSAMNDAARGAREANQTAGSYDRIAQSEQQQIDTIVGFFGKNDDLQLAPSPGYNGERYKATRSYRDLASAHRNEAEILTRNTGKADPRVDLKKAIVPKFTEIKVAKDGEAYIRNAGIAVRARLEGNVYILADLQAREMYRQSLAAGNQEAASMHARSALEFAWQAKGYANWAADHQHKSDVVYQKRLDESLTVAAKKGLTLPVLLEKFQSRIKESGLPAHLDEALTAAGANAEQRAAVKTRLLALTPEVVEAVLKERRARIGRGAEVPDAFIRDTRLMASRQEYHKLVRHAEFSR